jgi:hypothetical protein
LTIDTKISNTFYGTSINTTIHIAGIVLTIDTKISNTFYGTSINTTIHIAMVFFTLRSCVNATFKKTKIDTAIRITILIGRAWFLRIYVYKTVVKKAGISPARDCGFQFF